ncbi:MAG: long-chain fatty acid--CoA ligase, partial [Acidobacteriota bacterium]|nr:long-chain fatty acid--CoA ligase [Acidobacteriota bacterium]
MKKILSYELLTHKGSPFELKDAVINGIPCKIFPRGPQTLRDVFIKSAAFADREFIVKGDTRLTFGQAFRRASHFARSLRQKYGIKKGSRVALMMETGPEWAVVFMALCFAGAAPVVIPADAKRRAALKALELTNCELAVADISSAERINAPGMKLPVVIPIMSRPDAISRIDFGKSADFSIFNLADAPVGKNDADIGAICETAPDDEALISFTSGTTGKPKCAMFNHRNITTGLMNMMLGGLRMSFCAAKDRLKQHHDAQPCSLLLSPFSHAGGYSHLMLMCYLGGKIVLMPEWDAQTAAALIENERVRSLSGLSPVMAKSLLRADRSTDSLRSLTHMNIYGVALRRKFIRDLTDGFPRINLGTGYGMTETCGAVSVVSGIELLGNPELSGFALPSVDIKIVGRDGREAARGNYGEIWVRGAMV